MLSLSPQRHYPAFHRSSYHDPMYAQPLPPLDIGGDFFRERIRELAQQRARKAQWLPDEVDDSDDDSDYSQLNPHERKYFEALKAQQLVDHLRNEQEARATAMKEEAEKVRQAKEERARKLQDATQRFVAEQLNLRAERMKQHEHNAFTAGRNSSQSLPIHIPSNARSSSPKANPIREPNLQSPPTPLYTEKHATAASVIQQQFRIHQSLHTVSNIAAEFQTLKSAFVYPTVIDFQELEGEISVSTSHLPSEFDETDEVVVNQEDEGETQMEVDGPQPKLAYTAVNYSIHFYIDAMEKLLMKLDGVESWGNKGVRESRRSVVREIGKESAKLERYWKQAWIDYVEKQREGARKEEDEIEIDEEPVHVEHPDNDEWLDIAEVTPVVQPSGDLEEIEL